MAWHTQHLSRRALFTNAPTLSSMAAQGLHNQLHKPCLLSFPVSSPLATMIPCPVLEWQDAPPVWQASLHHTTHEKLTSGSNALLAPTQKVPLHNVQGYCLCAFVLAKQCTSSRSSTTYNVSKCGQQLPSAYAHTCAPTCVHTSFASSWHIHAAAAHALFTPSACASIQGTPTSSA